MNILPAGSAFVFRWQTRATDPGPALHSGVSCTRAMNLELSRVVLLFLVSAFAGCEERAQLDHARPPSSVKPELGPHAQGSTHRTFGAPILAARVLALSDVLAAPDGLADQAITVEGEVRTACTRRGCWLELATGAGPKLPACRVTFKDYGFFVPTNSAGAHAKVQGVLAVNTLPPERVRHLESEGGQFPDKHPDGSASELRLVATGVELWR
jgi:hypothetical protein